MGSYTIVISGHGINGNATERDADVMAKKFVQALREAGQEDVHGAFCYGVTGVQAPEAGQEYVSLSARITTRLDAPIHAAEPLALSDEERAKLPPIGNVDASGPMEYAVGEANTNAL